MTRAALACLALAACGPAKPPDGPARVDTSGMVELPSGTFLMGHVDEDPGMYGAAWKENELPQHPVVLLAYLMDRDEVTVADYARFLNAYGDATHWHPAQPVTWDGARYVAVAGEERRPMRQVSWYEAHALCAFLGKSLPTEAEWERAAKGPGGDRDYPWDGGGPSCARAVYFDGSALCEPGPAPVGSRSPPGDSPEGLHDLAGNVAEWVADWYGRYAGSATEVSPTGPETGTLRVVRGGGFRESAASIRTTARWGADPGSRSAGVGFRCVLR